MQSTTTTGIAINIPTAKCVTNSSYILDASPTKFCWVIFSDYSLKPVVELTCGLTATMKYFCWLSTEQENG